MSFQIVIDAAVQSSPNLVLDGFASRLDRSAANTFALPVGTYSIYLAASRPAAAFSFDVSNVGLIDYAIGFDVGEGGFLSGRGSNTLGLVGFDITVNTAQLAAVSWIIGDVTPWTPGRSVLALRLLPGDYPFVQGNGAIPDAEFEVRPNGTIDFAATSDGFLFGRGTSTFKVLGLPVTVDATRLSSLAFAIFITTGWLANSTSHVLNLLPGHYDFQQGNGVVPEAAFDVRLDGTVDYAASSDPCLAGRGTSTFRLLGLPVTIDATQLAAQAFAVFVTTGWLPHTPSHALNLLPGHYDFQQGNGVVAKAAFDVHSDGTVDYAASSDAFLSGRGTSTFKLLGRPVTIDATRLAAQTISVYLISGSLATDEPHPLNLLPGHYELQEGSRLVPETAFDVRPDGTIDYATSSDAFLAGRGTSTFKLLGLPITLDARPLSTPFFGLFAVTAWLPTHELQALNLLPGGYQFAQPTGTSPEADFTVRADGNTTYEPWQDAAFTPPGALEGRTTSSLRVVGFEILIDASDYTGDTVVLMPLGLNIDTALPNPVPVSLVSESGLSLELRTANTSIVLFDVTGNGTVVLDEPYPFVDLRWQGHRQVIRLTRNETRQKAKCCAPAAAMTELVLLRS